MKTRLRYAVGFTILAATFALPARAQTIGGEVLVRGDSLGGLTSDETMTSEPGATFIAWRDSRLETAGDIYVQKLSAAGAPLWTAGGLALCTAAKTQQLPSITPDGAGGAIVAWLDWRVNSPELIIGIFAQHVSAAGTVTWTANGIQVGTIAAQANPRPWVYPAGDGTFLVSWWETRFVNGQPTKYPVVAQKVAANGTLLWGPAGVDVIDDIIRGRSVPDGAGGLIVAGKIRNGGGFRFRRILADKSLAWAGPVDLATPLSDSVPFDFASDGAGGMVVSYLEGTTARAVRVTGDGALPWDATASTLSNSSVVTTEEPKVVGDGSGGAFVSWIASSPRDIRVQHVAANGGHLWAAGGVTVPNGSGSERDAFIAADGSGGVFLAFAPGNRGQRLDSNGAGLWGASALTVASGFGPYGVGSLGDGASFVYDGNSGLSAKKIFAQTTTLTSRLANISTRAFVGTGDQQAIPGFVIGGTGNKKVLIRAIGPTLGGFGVPGALADPVLTLSNSVPAVIATRNNWGEAGDAAEVVANSTAVGAFDLASGSLDAALVTTLAPGSYTAGITGAANGTGTGLVEIYDTGALGASSFLSNLSSRVFVGTGAQQAIPGIVIEGNSPLTLLIRAVGPTLGGFGVAGTLADPTLTLFNSASVAIATSNNWEEGGTAAANALKAAATTVGAFDLGAGSLDSAVLATLSPGSYTAGVSGVGGTTGIVLLEIYIVP